jgi:hypothetical protein
VVTALLVALVGTLRELAFARNRARHGAVGGAAAA